MRSYFCEREEVPERDQAPVLHGPHGEVGDGDAIVLLQGIRYAVEVLVVGDGLHAGVQSKLALKTTHVVTLEACRNTTIKPTNVMFDVPAPSCRGECRP